MGTLICHTTNILNFNFYIVQRFKPPSFRFRPPLLYLTDIIRYIGISFFIKSLSRQDFLRSSFWIDYILPFGFLFVNTILLFFIYYFIIILLCNIILTIMYFILFSYTLFIYKKKRKIKNLFSAPSYISDFYNQY